MGRNTNQVLIDLTEVKPTNVGLFSLQFIPSVNLNYLKSVFGALQNYKAKASCTPLSNFNLIKSTRLLFDNQVRKLTYCPWNIAPFSAKVRSHGSFNIRFSSTC